MMMNILNKPLKNISKKRSIRKSDTDNLQYFRFGFYIIIIFFAILLLVFGVNYYIFFKTGQNMTNFNIHQYEKIYYNTLNKFKKSESSDINEIKLKYYLIMNNFNELSNFLNKMKNKKIYLKYFGILCYKKKLYNQAIKNLSLYLKKYKYDRDVISYLANAYYEKGDYSKAITIYNKIKDDNFETAYNRAIIFENIGDIKDSLKYYRKSFNLVKDPLLKKRIYNKIYLIESYETKQN